MSESKLTHVGRSILLVVGTKPILVFILFLDIELRGWHLEDWYRVNEQAACDSKST
jgi:hypothetical protein